MSEQGDSTPRRAMPPRDEEPTIGSPDEAAPRGRRAAPEPSASVPDPEPKPDGAGRRFAEASSTPAAPQGPARAAASAPGTPQGPARAGTRGHEPTSAGAGKRRLILGVVSVVELTSSGATSSVPSS